MPLVESRYAEALINISAQKGQIDAFEQDFQSVVDVFNNQEDFRLFLLSPEVGSENKKETLKKLFSGNISDEVLNLLMLLVDKGRIRHLPGILEEFTVMADKQRNTLSMTIITTSPLSEDQINTLRDKYKKIYGAASVKATVEIDSSLIGGIRVKIGDEVVDGSIKGRLEGLRNILMNK